MQVVFSKDISVQSQELAQQLRSEFVVSVRGKVVERASGTIIPKFPRAVMSFKLKSFLY